MESISVFDMLKIGVGPSSSHTLGPWRAAERFVKELEHRHQVARCSGLVVELYGSLALTGHGHGTDLAILLGLSGEDPETIPPEQVLALPAQVQRDKTLLLGAAHAVHFDPLAHLHFLYSECLPAHANGLIFKAFDEAGDLMHRAVYYSVGGGFVVKDGEETDYSAMAKLPFPIHTAQELQAHCMSEGAAIWEIVLANERTWRPPSAVKRELMRIWEVMKQCMYRGCHTSGQLPGGLNVTRRAAGMHRALMGSSATYANADEWMACIQHKHHDFSKTLKWIGCFAMAVNEENANFGRVVTAPTNGAAGVIPAVLMYYICFTEHEALSDDHIAKFLMVAAEVGSIFKKGATISAAMGGCQAEIGVSSAMAAAALTESMGGTVRQALMAAEIAMEHHLGLTCDPVGGLVQVPCIERNSMGAIKAITAANIALDSDPDKARVSLDEVISSMWQTAQDMNSKYKETSQGGLATNISIAVPEC